MTDGQWGGYKSKRGKGAGKAALAYKLFLNHLAYYLYAFPSELGKGPEKLKKSGMTVPNFATDKTLRVLMTD